MGGKPASGAGMMEHTHTCTRVLTLTEALSHTCLHLHTTIPTANIICTDTCVALTRTARHVYTHITRILTPKLSPHNHAQAGYIHIHVQGFKHTILSFAYTHTIHACAHSSYVGLCQRAHTQAAHDPIQMPSRTHMHRNQIKEVELCKSHGPCLSLWGSPCMNGHFLWLPLSP